MMYVVTWTLVGVLKVLYKYVIETVTWGGQSCLLLITPPRLTHAWVQI